MPHGESPDCGNREVGTVLTWYREYIQNTQHHILSHSQDGSQINSFAKRSDTITEALKALSMKPSAVNLLSILFSLIAVAAAGRRNS